MIRPLSTSVINNIKFYICDTSVDKHNPGHDQASVYLCNNNIKFYICDTSIDRHNPGVFRPLSMSVINNIKFYICDTSIDRHNPGHDQASVYICN